jgi:hypothetical protein
MGSVLHFIFVSIQHGFLQVFKQIQGTQATNALRKVCPASLLLVQF